MGASHKKTQSGTFRLLHAKNTSRPQLRFREKIDNSNTPFVPKLFVKPNALKPLPEGKGFIFCWVTYLRVLDTHLSSRSRGEFIDCKNK